MSYLAVELGAHPSVELYDKRKDTWSVVEQKRIPPNNLGAFEIERRVYFLINNFPIDSGIRIPPEKIENWQRPTDQKLK